MIVFSDLHLKESNEDLCFRVLEKVAELAVADDGHLVCCGDFWHLRYRVNVRLLNRVMELFDEWDDRTIDRLDFVPGNHDQVTVAGANALEVFGAFERIHVWTQPGVADVNRRVLGFIPYRKDPGQQVQELEHVMDQIPEFAFGHFGVRGAIMNAGRRDQDGLEVPAFHKEVRRLFLGHYHRIQEPWPGITYVGSPFQHTFGEVGNRCGVWRVPDPPGPGRFIPLDVGAPRHHIVRWDGQDQLQKPEDWREGDKVRVDLEAPQGQLAKPGAAKALKAAGLEDAQVQVVPQREQREHRFEMPAGEDLAAAAKRFANERCEQMERACELTPETERMNQGGYTLARLLRKLEEWTT